VVKVRNQIKIGAANDNDIEARRGIGGCSHESSLTYGN
jgi:hypothetical protein